jgi:hypothetical protein
LELICRKVAGEGLGDPEALQASTSLEAQFVGPAEVNRGPGGMVQTLRRIEVALPASEKVGTRQGGIRLRWAGDTTREFPIIWEVVPVLRVSPATLLLSADQAEQSRTIVVRSTDSDHPFRILDVSGPTVAGYDSTPDEAGVIHRVDLKFEPSRSMDGETSDVTITTDHPVQRATSLKILVASAPPESVR